MIDTRPHHRKTRTITALLAPLTPPATTSSPRSPSGPPTFEVTYMRPHARWAVSYTDAVRDGLEKKSTSWYRFVPLQAIAKLHQRAFSARYRERVQQAAAALLQTLTLPYICGCGRSFTHTRAPTDTTLSPRPLRCSSTHRRKRTATGSSTTLTTYPLRGATPTRPAILCAVYPGPPFRPLWGCTLPEWWAPRARFRLPHVLQGAKTVCWEPSPRGAPEQAVGALVSSYRP